MKILAVGDIIGKPGRTILEKYLKKNISKYDLVIVNGENSASGFGITEKVAEDFFDIGVDVITSGNHIWDRREVYGYIASEHRLLRPLNYPSGVPGNGSGVFNAKNGEKVAVINIQGRVFMNETDSPFVRIKDELEEIKKETNVVIVDFHAEATSEKIAMGWYLDGEISLLYGTHTHVMTADNRILNNGTGYITDIGMTGGADGVIGTIKDKIIEKFLTSLPQKFEVCDQNIRINAIESEIDSETGKCLSITRVDLGLNEV